MNDVACCKNCRYNKRVKGKDGKYDMICVNEDSDNYYLDTIPDESCIDFEEKVKKTDEC